jgi:cytochrome b561
MQHTIAMQPAGAQVARHDPTTIAFHWISAVLVAVIWGIGQTVDVPPNGLLRTDYRSLHIVLGVVLGAVLLARLAWRVTRNGMLPPLDHGLLLFIARATHWALYALIILAVILGLGTAWVRGDTLFGWFSIPAYDPGNRALIHLIQGWHALAANAIMIIAGVHATAALFHHYILRDATLRRMLPWDLP